MDNERSSSYAVESMTEDELKHVLMIASAMKALNQMGKFPTSIGQARVMMFEVVASMLKGPALTSDEACEILCTWDNERNSWDEDIA